MVDPEIPLGGGSHSKVVRVGQTVRRVSRSPSVSSAVFELLQHVELEGFAGAPRALGFDDQGREVLGYIEGEVAAQRRPGQPGGGDLPNYVWHDEVLVHLGALIRAYHDAAATFPWAGREWLLEARQPVETVCHNEAFPWNTVFRAGRWRSSIGTPRRRGLALGTSDSSRRYGCRFGTTRYVEYPDSRL